jgi:hypothetical protein
MRDKTHAHRNYIDDISDEIKNRNELNGIYRINKVKLLEKELGNRLTINRSKGQGKSIHGWNVVVDDGIEGDVNKWIEVRVDKVGSNSLLCR